MACLFEIQFPASTSQRRPAAAAFDLIDDLEAQLSVYQANSEISQFNNAQPNQWVSIESRLYSLLSRCRDLTRATDGAFDFTSGPLIRAWGFIHRQGRIPTERESEVALQSVGMNKIEFSDDRRSLRKRDAGVEINLGAVGKGYTLDRVAEQLRSQSFGPALLAAGHSSVLAIGQPTWDSAWQVDLSHPLDRSRRMTGVRLRDWALSTSGVAEQSFTHDDRRLGHLLDPRTGQPAQGMLQASAVAADATLAEVLSTAFFVNGVDWTREFCERHRNVGAILVPDVPSSGNEGSSCSPLPEPIIFGRVAIAPSKANFDGLRGDDERPSSRRGADKPSPTI